MDDTWQVGGLPLHPLLVHAVVVLVPLAVGATMASQLWPGLRRRLGVVTPLLAVAVAVLVPVTIRAGEQLKQLVGPIPAVLTHEARGRALLPWVVALAVVSLAQWAWFRRADTAGRAGTAGRATGTPTRVDRRTLRAVGWLLSGLVVLVGLGTLAAVVLAGDTGARAVWGAILG
ncbi:DUF2231 domain-containing protein [Demequina capsici]|uniref:DUF2231 domain-containing protein n=1 Tax=Demequina capsici TaxID=3075620 RepID=A0AA96J8N1_9MICO|nr:DUF2231 domain-containing protein [Demequina sp. PMTSA13]WNM26382.1 DUF2231 domain-containing protein [Demequina sp. PMTSA13]